MKLHRNEDWLYQKYWIEGCSTLEMAELVGCARMTIWNWMKKLGIPTRTRSKAIKLWLKAHPEARKEKNSPNWQGGKYIDGQGYTHLYRPDHPYAHKSKYITMHRLVMERKLGRFLEPNEKVYHLNGISNDNSPGNLSLSEPSVERMQREADSGRSAEACLW